MAADLDLMGFTAVTCRWLPCEFVIEPPSRREFCSDSHRVRADQEARRLIDLLEELSTSPATMQAVVAGLPKRNHEQRLSALRSRLERRILMLRPDWRPPPPGHEPPDEELRELLERIVTRWPSSEVAALVQPILMTHDRD